jgi:hypothetical protein
MNLPSLKVLPQFELPQPMQQLQKHIQDQTSSMQSKQLLLLQHLQIQTRSTTKTAVTNPMMKAAYSPTKGGKPVKLQMIMTRNHGHGNS